MTGEFEIKAGDEVLFKLPGGHKLTVLVDARAPHRSWVELRTSSATEVTEKPGTCSEKRIEICCDTGVF